MSKTDDRSPKRASRAISFRSALLVGVLAILLAAVGVSGVYSYLNARVIVSDLSRHVLQQTAARVQDRLRILLDGAAHVGETQARRLSRKAWTIEDLPALQRRFHETILLNPDLSYVSIGLEVGGYTHVYRAADGHLEGRMQIVRADGRSSRDDARIVDGVLTVMPELSAFDDYDPRKRGWYQLAKDAGVQTWPPVYLFKNAPNPDYPGLTCATPVRGPDGTIQGVTTADFDLLALGRFLGALDVLEGGTAFVVEVAPNGTKRVVAHPDPATLLGRVDVDGEAKDMIFPVDKIPNAPVRTLVERIAVDRAPELVIQRVHAEDVEYVAAYQPLKSRHDLNWIVAVLVPRDGLMAPVESASRDSLWIGLASLLLAAGLTWFLSRRIAKPLESLVADTEAIGRFELQPSESGVSRFAELRRLSAAMEEMKSGLRSFERYVPSDVVRGVLESGQEVALGGERRELSVCFTDIEDFTALAERMRSEDLVELLGEYFEVVTDAFVASKGTVDKYIGDAVMAFWGAPQPHLQHARQACRGALDARARVAKLRERLVAEGRHPIRVRFGVGTGELVVGNIGSTSRMNYTVIGDPVNLASRLEGLNKMYGTEILIGERTRAAAGDAIVARPMERVSVKGQMRGAMVYELLAMREAATEEDLARERDYTEALALFHARDFAGARAAYEGLLERDPKDMAAFVLAQAAWQLHQNPPPADWTGVRKMDVK